MSIEIPNLVIEKEFGPEFAGQRVGWSAVIGYGDFRPDKVFGIHLATATVSEDGASLEYEPREENGQTRAYWSHAAKGFIDAAGVTVIIDTEEDLDDRPRIGPYWSFNDDKINGTSSGQILRSAGDGHDEEKLEDIKTWAESPQEILANTKRSMSEMGLTDYYPAWYYTVNVVLGHEGYRNGTPLRSLKLPPEAAILPDAEMVELTKEEIETTNLVISNLAEVEQIDETMMRNLTAFGDIPAEEIPAAFQASREKIFEVERQTREIYKQLRTQIGIYLPVGCTRTWPYISADIKSSDSRAFGAELKRLKAGDPSLAQSELKDERNELEYRKNHASQGVAALRLLARAEEALNQAD